MIDTIRINFNPPRPLRRSFDETKAMLREDSRWSYSYDRMQVGERWVSGIMLKHGPSKLRIGIAGDSAVYVETSLPRLVFGYNGSLITEQSQIESAFSLIEGQLQQWALNPNETGWGRGYEFVRIDLVLQFEIPDIPATEMIQSIAIMNHPDCRKGRGDWFFNGFNSVTHLAGKMKITAYDKELQLDESRGLGETLRLEARLEGSPLQRFLGPEPGVCPRELNFDECYQAYRAIMHGFRPSSCKVGTTRNGKDRSKQDVLLDVFAHACRVNLLMPDGRTPLDHLRSCGACKKTKKDTLRDIAGRNLAVIGVDWPELFPEQWPPPYLTRSVAEQLHQFRGTARRQNRESQ
ncbi:hypothetical protein HZ994_11645 [Akkermansiaceae bacterium]|nr:hypothetical protein HZ994_11645 [Akkermansiaceae bacterium]